MDIGHTAGGAELRADEKPDGVIVAAAVLLVQYSDKAWVGLLEKHVPDSTGHCAGSGCRGQMWPCVLCVIARHAELLAARPLRAVIEQQPDGPA